MSSELISFTAWKKNYEEYRRPIDFFKNLFSSDVQKLPLLAPSFAIAECVRQTTKMADLVEFNFINSTKMLKSYHHKKAEQIKNN